MKLTALTALFLALLLFPPAIQAEDEPPDAFSEALRDMGITEADLGYHPAAHLSRYPHPKTTPYILPFFEDLLARPLDTYVFTRTLGNVVEDLLTPERLTAPGTDKDRKETLFKLGVALATDRRIGGFRGYSANLDPLVTAEAPLANALETLLERSGRPLRRPMAFGAKYDTGTPSPRDELTREVAAVPEALRPALARLVLNLIQAREWIDLGLRKVTPEMRAAVFDSLPSLSEDTPDGTGYYPVIDDVAAVIDEHSLHYGALKAMQAVQDARRELGAMEPPEGGWPRFEFQRSTPWGSVLLADALHGKTLPEEGLLTVLLGGELEVKGPLGATSPNHTLSVALVFGGARTPAEPPNRMASGILGAGILYAAGDHANVWNSDRFGLGAALFGLGALIDEGGDDLYGLASVGMGAGFFGAGLLLDAAGDDEYRLREGDGQGFGGPGGIGVLADRSGDDLYFSEPNAAEAGRADYHSAHEIAVSNAQGVGSGRRGDGSDGHSWAGGLGALIDVDGNDTYRAGNFSQGLGYWYGTGLLWDGGGDDRYLSVYFTQGSGAHFAVGALIDESGDDLHVLGANAGAAFGFGWDVVNAFLIDRGDGNDRYLAKIISTGLAEVRSNAFFLDEGGDDLYVLDRGTLGFGAVDKRPNYDTPPRAFTYPYLLNQVGVFLDLGGKDRYVRRGKGRDTEADAEAGDGRTWNLAPRANRAGQGVNVSVGRDVEGGRLGFLDAWPARRVEGAGD
jgi:hypothetical protein